MILGNTHWRFSFSVLDHGHFDADLHDLRNANQHRIYAYLFVIDSRVFTLDCWLLAVSGGKRFCR